MSHSRKIIGLDNVLSLQEDLKNNYNRSQLQILAKHYDISPLLNKERLTMEIARANLHSSKRQKARMTSDDRQKLINTLRGCHTHLDQVATKFDAKQRQLGNLLTDLWTSLEDLSKSAPEAFDKIVPKVLGDCEKELNEIDDCLTKAGAKIEDSLKKKLADIKDFLEKLKIEEPPKVKPKIPGIPVVIPPGPPPLPPKKLPPGIEPGPPSLSPTPPTSIPPPIPPKELPPWLVSLPKKPATLPKFVSPLEPKLPLTAPGQLEEVQPPTIAPPTPPTPKLPPTEEIWPYPSPPPTPPKEVVECETDEDCEEKQAAGLLSGLHPKQKVICVTKRDGTHECVYQA